MKKRRETWNATKLNLILSKEDFTAMIGMLAVGIAGCSMLSAAFPFFLVGLICAQIGIFFLTKTLKKIFVESAHGNTGILVSTLPVNESSLRRGRYAAGTLTLLCAVSGLILAACGSYLGLFGFSMDNLIHLLNILYFEISPEFTNIPVVALLPVELVFILLLSLCISAGYEYAAAGAYNRSYSNSLTGNDSQFNIPWIVCIGAILLPRIIFLLSDNIPLIVIHLVRNAALGVLTVVFISRSSKRGKKIQKHKEKQIFDDSMKLNKIQTYTRLVGGNGKLLEWKTVMSMTPIILLLFLNPEWNSMAIVFLIASMLCTMTNLVQEWNTNILLDENATFFYGLPIRNEDRVRIHMKIGFKCIATLPIIFTVLASVAAISHKCRAAIGEIISKLIGMPDSGIMTVILIFIWILIIMALALIFSGWSFFNSIFASRWRDPLTHKTSRFAGGLCLGTEAVIHIAALAVVLPFNHINPIIGSVIILIICIAEGYLAYRLSIRELRDMYSA